MKVAPKIAPIPVVVLSAGVLLSLTKHPKVLAAIPALSGISKRLANSGGGCGGCGRKKSAARIAAMNDVRKVIEAMPPDQRNFLKRWLNAKTLRLYNGKSVIDI